MNSNTETPSRPVVWPLFVVAMTVMAGGLTVVFLHLPQAGQAKGTPVEMYPALEVPDKLDVPTEAQAIKLAPEATQQWTWSLEQRSTRSRGTTTTGEVTTRMQLAGVDTFKAHGESRWRVDRKTTDATVDVRDADSVVGPEIAPLVAFFLKQGAARFDLGSQGLIEDYIWTSKSSPQVAQTFALIRDIQVTFSPRLPPEPIVGGESWSWREPLRATLDHPERLKLDGELEAKATYLGRASSGDVIRVTLTVAGLGSASEDINYKLEGRGSATVLVARGKILAQDLELKQTLRVSSGQAEPVLTSSTIVLRQRTAKPASD